MIGSTCFAVASIPGFANLVAASVVGAVYFVGSVFFTSAATGQLVQVDRSLPGAATRRSTVAIRARSLEWSGTVIQLIGTLWFNLNTFDALLEGLDTRQQDLRIWTPDFIGSICFLVASCLAIRAVSAHPWRWHRADVPWRIAALNLVGSVFFMVAALAAFVRPETDDLLDASLANSGTLLGAVCFFWALACCWCQKRRLRRWTSATLVVTSPPDPCAPAVRRGYNGPGQVPKREVATMHAKPGDRIEVDSVQVGAAPRQGEVVEVLDADRSEHYRIRWSDGHESVYFPSSDARVIGRRRQTQRR